MKKFFKTAIAIFLMLGLCACASDGESEAESESSDYIIGVNDPHAPVLSYCFSRYLTDSETRTIAEVFTGEEVTMGHLIMRTQPNKRAGMYFFLMFGYEPDAIALGCTFELSVDNNKQPKPQTYTFTVPETYPTLREVKLGITGKDWPSPDARVNAWKLVLKAPDGKILLEEQSWLWGMKYGNRSQKNADNLLKEIPAK